jgi:hypothetical protein
MNKEETKDSDTNKSKGPQRTMTCTRPQQVVDRGVVKKKDLSAMHKKNVPRPTLTKAQAKKAVEYRRKKKMGDFISSGLKNRKIKKSKLKLVK